MQKITAIIPCKNEEHNIEAVLESVKWCDEIMVVDSFSTDKTIELAKKYTSSILKHDYLNSANQKNWAIPQAKYEWILLVDADERVTPELKAEIQTILQQQEIRYNAFSIGRKSFFMGKEIKFSGWQHDKVTRLFKRDTCRYEEKWVHAEIITTGKVRKLKNKFHHYTFKDIFHYRQKIDRYSIWGAYDASKKIVYPNAYHFIVKPAIRFIKHYVVNLGFLDGKAGFTISSLAAKSVYMRYKKLALMRKEQTNVVHEKSL